MKTISLIAALVLGTFVVGVAQSSADIKSVAQESVAIWSSGQPSSVQILIRDADNTVVHKESLYREGTIAKQFNLKNLDKGVYKVEIEDNESIRTYSLVKGRRIDIEREGQVVRTPVVSQKGASVYVMAPMSNNNTRIFIFNSKNDLIHQQNVKKNSDKIQMLDFSKIEGGEYTISIVSNGRTFNHKILVD